MIDIQSLLTVAGLAVFLGVLMQFLKTAFNLNTDQIPAIAVLLGVILELVIAYACNLLITPQDILVYTFNGILAALSATGGYENITKLLTNKTTAENPGAGGTPAIR